MPLVAMGLMGKRLNRFGRISDAVTIPEVLSKRFDSPTLGILGSLMIVVFTFVYLLAQFKAGSKILSSLLRGVSLYELAVSKVDRAVSGIPYLAAAEPDYLLCLFVFSVAVIGYVVYGGFRAVVWTDVMQGVVMFFGVLILLVLALYQVGGLASANEALAKRVPPTFADAELVADSNDHPEFIPIGKWLKTEGGKLARLKESVDLTGAKATAVRVLILNNDDETRRNSRI